MIPFVSILTPRPLFLSRLLLDTSVQLWQFILRFRTLARLPDLPNMPDKTLEKTTDENPSPATKSPVAKSPGGKSPTAQCSPPPPTTSSPAGILPAEHWAQQVCCRAP